MSMSCKLPVFLLAAALLCAPSAQAREAGGFEFPEQAQASGQPVSLVGVGVRTKWMMTIYGMGAYQKTVKQQASWLVQSDEPKMLWLHMARGISAEKMRDAIDNGIEKNTPEAERAAMAPDVERIKAAFPANIAKGLDIQFIYTPGKGTTLRLGSADKVTVAGVPFMKAIWRIWFGHAPADSGLADSVLGK